MENNSRQKFMDNLNNKDDTLSSFINALPYKALLLDKKGFIIAANENWKEFEQENNIYLKNCQIGDNYLKKINLDENHNDKADNKVSENIKKVLMGKADEFSTEYSCPYSKEKLWVKIKVKSLASGALVIHENITDKKELKLLQSKIKINEIFNNIEEVVWSMSWPDLNLQYMSKSVTEIIGYSREDFKENHRFMTKITHPEDKHIHKKALKELKKNGYTEREFRIICKDGSNKWIHDKNQLIYNENGDPIRVEGIARNITERKEMEEELKLTQFSADKAPLGIFLITPAGEFEYINEEVCKMLGYTREELIGKKISDIDPNYPQEEREKVWKTIKETGLDQDETHHISKQGNLIPINVISKYIKYKGEEHELAFVQDITERKEKETKLKKQNNRIKKLHKFAIELAEVNSEKKICENTVTAAENVLDFELSHVSLVEEKMLVPKAASRESDAVIRSINKGLAGKTYREGKSFMVDDAQNNPYTSPTKKSYKSGISIPIGNYGIFQAISTKKEAFTREDFELAELLVSHTTEALKRIYSQERLKYKSLHDELTGLNNRSFIETKMSELDREDNLPISIIMADINGLKIINESLGHNKGDELLKKAARILQNNIRKKDILGRYAGDEFVILLPQTSNKKAHRIYERILKKCNKTETDELPLSLGMGIATKTDKNQDIENILEQADDTMYQDKLVNNKSKKSKVVQSLLNTLGAKSDETREHTLRMTDLAHKLGKKMGVSNSELNKLSLLATLHDIGKTSIPEEILTKSGDLTEEEWQMIKEHPQIGYKIASATPEFSVIAEEVRAHHERWDGNGYPQGLEKEEIPYLARIITIVDSYDVMTHERPYTPPISQKEALKELKNCAGSQFDPELVKEFVKII